MTKQGSSISPRAESSNGAKEPNDLAEHMDIEEIRLNGKLAVDRGDARRRVHHYTLYLYADAGALAD